MKYTCVAVQASDGAPLASEQDCSDNLFEWRTQNWKHNDYECKFYS